MKEYTLNEKTTIPVAWLFAGIPFIAACIFGFSELYMNEQADAKAIIRTDKRVDDQYVLLLDMRDSQIRIEQFQKDMEKRDRKRTNN